MQGVLWHSRGAWFVFRDVALLRAGSPPTPLDGEVVIHRSHVSFLQVLP